MDFLKQHYEKIVLGVLLLSFVFAMIYLLQMVGSARDVTLENLKFSAPASAYESANFKDKAFNIEAVLGENGVWQPRPADEKLGFGAELVAPMKAIRCSACQKIVPLSIVKSKLQCPICDAKLENPPEISDITTDYGGVDTDGDGMPDAYEQKMDFRPNDASDASQDADGDGFSNLYEYLMGTNPRDAKSFPGLDKRIYLVRLRKVLLPVRLEGVTQISDPKDKESKRFWDIALTLNRQRTSVVIGSEIEVGRQRYKVADAIYRPRDVQDSSIVLTADDSSVFLEPVGGGEKIELRTGQRVYAPNHKAVIEDISNGNVYTVGVGETFQVGDDKSGRATFQVTATDAVKEHVTLLNQDTGAEILLTRDIKIPPEARVNNNARDGIDPGLGLPEDMGPRPTRRSRNRN